MAPNGFGKQLRRAELGLIVTRGIHVQIMECVWNGVLIRSQHGTAKTYCRPSFGWYSQQQDPSMGCGAAAYSLSYGGLCNWSERSSMTILNWAVAWLAFGTCEVESGKRQSTDRQIELNQPMSCKLQLFCLLKWFSDFQLLSMTLLEFIILEYYEQAWTQWKMVLLLGCKGTL